MSFRQRPSADPVPSSSSSDSVELAPPPPKSVLSRALDSSAHLANLLPTGTVLAFQLLTPIVTNNGFCDSTTRPLTLLLLLVLAASCLLASFTDSIRSPDGHLHYGFVTLRGLWLFDRQQPRADLVKYRLALIDVAHAALSVLVFVAVAWGDNNVVRCFHPQPPSQALGLFRIAPIGIGFVSSLLFVIFPSRRHGIGYPVTRIVAKISV